jgi:hypothetical protein
MKFHHAKVDFHGIKTRGYDLIAHPRLTHTRRRQSQSEVVDLPPAEYIVTAHKTKFYNKFNLLYLKHLRAYIHAARIFFTRCVKTGKLGGRFFLFCGSGFPASITAAGKPFPQEVRVFDSSTLFVS